MIFLEEDRGAQAVVFWLPADMEPTPCDGETEVSGSVHALGYTRIEIADGQDAHRWRSFGFKISSSANPHSVNASTTNTMARPGGTIHHHCPA